MAKKQYNFNEVNNVAKVGAAQLERWLLAQNQTIQVKNVEEDSTYQAIDVDLLWFTKKKAEGYKVEIKVDRLYKTGNFFFETYSNLERQTPGCFMYTEADLVFYYYLEPQHLFILPMPSTRDWFIEHRKSFNVRDTSTPVGDSYYTTQGCLVPRQQVLDNVTGVQEYFLKKS